VTSSRGARVVTVLGVLLFWVGVFVAGGLVNGYSAREDYISSLASRGSPVAALGIAALLANTAAHLATARAVLTGWRARLCALFLVAAGVALTAVAVFRQSCPEGPPRCGLADTPPADWVDVVHGASVGVYQLFTLAAMLTLTVGALRRNSAPPRWLGWVSLAFAAGSVALISQTNGDHLGMWQRLWLANNLVWLLLVAWTATARERVIGRAR
jgi:Protein of unknown function (DUF998)